MKIWIGIDDTDSRNGGCTTYLACMLIRELINKKIDIIGFPRLVRLNPNIPWKTRGNGAISFQVGKGTGKRCKIGQIQNLEIFGYNEKSKKTLPFETVKKRIEEIIDKYAELKAENTNPGYVILEKKPDYNTYVKTVQKIVSIDEIKDLLKNLKGYFQCYKNGRGIIGATASVAWSPSSDYTYELITYREKEKWGTNRDIEDRSTKEMDKIISSTFDNYDYKNDHNRLVPNSPCPVLFGIRGDIVKDLIKAKSMIKSEQINSWLIFQSNQGTDAHLQVKRIGDIQPYNSVISKGMVCKQPFTIEGGHVIFQIKESDRTIDCAAYEPTKQFRDVIRKLIVGDIVQVFGGVRKQPLTINLEKINIIKLKDKKIKIENPVCPKCGKHMKSKGKNQGYKCIKCGTFSNKPIYKSVERKLNTGFYEVPVCARRHLSKPLKRSDEP